jgi:tetratricopeptide (TPR) repeat protein
MQAIACHPDRADARVNLGNLLLEAGEFGEARAQYDAALRADPAHREAHQGLAIVCDELEDETAAEAHRRAAFESRPATELPYRGAGEPVRAVMLVSARGGNIPARLLLDERVFHNWAVVAEYWPGSRALPPHQLVFNAIGDADRARPALDAATVLLAGTAAPVINPPERVLPTGRIGNARHLAGLPGVVVPKMESLPRALLERGDGAAALSDRGFRFPLLLRSLGFHTGRHFAHVAGPADLGAAVARLPGPELAAIEFLDARGADGKFRKYRAMIIDGEIYPLHLAISSDWKVHYFTAEMADNAAHRTEEQAFLSDMTAAIGATAERALEAVRDALRLDYMGVDFALSPQGELLLFEANATMVINPPEPDERWAHRRPAVERALAAARAMLIRRAAGSTLQAG